MYAIDKVFPKNYKKSLLRYQPIRKKLGVAADSNNQTGNGS